MNFVLILAAQRNALGVTPQHLGAIAQAVTVQMNRDFSPIWGGLHLVRVSTGPDDVLPGECAFTIGDSLPDAGAVAEHDINGDGVPEAAEAIDMCSSILTGPDSLSVGVSHECLEAGRDADVNLWVDVPPGLVIPGLAGPLGPLGQVADEVSDPVESSVYEIGGVTVSDFVTPDFWSSRSKGRYSFLGIPAGPFLTTHGGYQIVRDIMSGVQAVPYGETRRPLHAPKRAHRTSRAAKREALWKTFTETKP